jgi:hypothetical protein
LFFLGRRLPTTRDKTSGKRLRDNIIEAGVLIEYAKGKTVLIPRIQIM